MSFVIYAFAGIFVFGFQYRFLLVKSHYVRCAVSLAALGLKHRPGRTPRPHAICNIQSIATFDDWVKSLSRSGRNTMKKQIDKAFAANNLQSSIAGEAYRVLSFNHWLVCVDHERRAEGSLLAGLLHGTLRFLSAKLMEGSWIEETRDGSGRLVAWSASVVKGHTMRLMWFYQRTEVSRALIWFSTLRSAVKRAFELKTIHHIDLGPSKGEDVIKLKASYGFISTFEWKSNDLELPNSGAWKDEKDKKDEKKPSLLCDYDGPYVNLNSFQSSNRIITNTKQLKKLK